MYINDFKKLVIESAMKSGFSDCEVYYEGGKSFEVMIYDGEIAQYENSVQAGVSFRGTYLGKMGYSYSENIDVEAVDFLINEAKQNAEIIEDTQIEMLYCGDKEYPQVNGFSEALKNISVEEKINSAKKMEIAAKNENNYISDVDYCLTAYGEQEISISNTKGLDGEFKSNFATAYVSVIAQKGEDIKTGSEYWIDGNWEGFNPSNIGISASRTAVSHLGAESIKSGEYKILLQNNVASDFLSTFAGVFFAENVQKGFSMLNNKIGTTIAGNTVTLKDDGLYEGGMGSVPFDSEGVKSSNKYIIENGVLKTYLYNLKSAMADGRVSTGNGFKPSFKSTVQTACTNFYIERGSKTLEQLINDIGDGLLITDLAGLHSGANAVSGDFSLSAEGFLIENGSIKKPVEQITIAGNFYELIKNIIEVGNDLRFNMPTGIGTMGSPSVYVKSLSVSGI